MGVTEYLGSFIQLQFLDPDTRRLSTLGRQSDNTTDGRLRAQGKIMRRHLVTLALIILGKVIDKKGNDLSDMRQHMVAPAVQLGMYYEDEART